MTSTPVVGARLASYAVLLLVASGAVGSASAQNADSSAGRSVASRAPLAVGSTRAGDGRRVGFAVPDENGTDDQATARRRSPGLALLFSFIGPSGGQWYNGQYVKAGIMLGTSVGLLGVYVYGLVDYVACDDAYYFGDDYYYDDYDDCDASLAVAAIGLVGYMGVYIWSLIDAPTSAARINRRNAAMRTSMEFGPRLERAAVSYASYQPGLGAIVQRRDGVYRLSLARLSF
jgi:hypothetical protein